MSFESRVQEERGGLALVDGIVYVSYSGYSGDCDNYHGWVVGVDINNPSTVKGWATTAIGGGIWGHGGVASDGTNMFVVTGNTFNTAGNWMGGEAIIRLQAGPFWSGQAADYWAPTNWFNLDLGDTDLGGVSATVVDVPGAIPSELVLALGKDGNAYLLDRNNLGGISSPVTQANVSGINRGTSAVTYHTRLGTYIAFHNEGNAIKAYKVTTTSPPTLILAWSQTQDGRGSPWVTTIDGTNNTIVWVAGTGMGGDQRLHGLDVNTPPAAPLPAKPAVAAKPAPRRLAVKESEFATEPDVAGLTQIDDAIDRRLVIRSQVSRAQRLGWIERREKFRRGSHRAESGRERESILAVEQRPGRIERRPIKKRGAKWLGRGQLTETNQTGQSEKSATAVVITAAE